MSRPALKARSTNVPFLEAAAAPKDETPEERQIRMQNEEEAKRASDEIDAELEAERERLRAEKASGSISLLLLGQSESGKTTLLKQFQLMHAPTTFDEERQCWKAVILLNVINTLRNLIQLITEEPGLSPPELDPLQTISAELLSQEDVLANRLVGSGQFQRPSSHSSRVYMRRGDRPKFRASFSRKSMEQQLPPPKDPDLERSLGSITDLLCSQRNNIKGLWNNSDVKRLVKNRLQDDWRSFFVDDLDRILVPGYSATDDDILRCRIMTMGITEHTFHLQPRSGWRSKSEGVDWHIYDVAGSRGQRHAWAPFFEDATAIIFMAPLSAFDQYLSEDMAVNRVQDSLELFTKICKNPLLAKTEIVLFFNKMDLLKDKLRAGVKIADFIPSYGNRPNDQQVVQKYFEAHFRQVFNDTNKQNRSIYIHHTSVVDTLATRKIIVNVQESILAAHLKQAKLLV